MSEDKISYMELVEIFNTTLNKIPFDLGSEILGFEPLNKTYRNESHFIKKYYDLNQGNIEEKITVFEYVPKQKIQEIIEEFIIEINRYIMGKDWKKKNAKKLQTESYNLRKKDIKIIEQYQEMIYEYTSDYDYNQDEEYSILESKLDDVYWFNEMLLEELRTKNFKILDAHRYTGAKMYDSTKKQLKTFFKRLKNEYPIKSSDIKQMIDIL